MKFENKTSNESFGYFFSGVFLCVIAYTVLIELYILSYVFCSMFLCILCTTLIKPSLLKPINNFWHSLGFMLSKITSPIVLGVMFFLIITPVAIITRIFGRDELRLRRKPMETYWVDRDTDCKALSREFFKNQY
jgi:hypothetical protein